MPNTEMQEAREQLAEAADAGTLKTRLERRLTKNRPLSRDQRNALWLSAWSQAERRQLRRWARQLT